MKLRELTGYKDHPMMKTAQDTFQNKPDDLNRMDPNKSSLEYAPYYQIIKFNKYLSDHGFRQLGAGAYAGVWEHPNHPWVFKVFKGDEAYLKYYQFCRANQSNPNVPRIKGHPIRINDETYAIRMEKLTPIDKGLYNDVDNGLASFEGYARGVKKGWDAERMNHIRQGLVEFQSKYPGIYDIMVMLYKSGYRLDLHFNNIMQRGNVPVITDPIVGSGWGNQGRDMKLTELTGYHNTPIQSVMPVITDPFS